MKRVKLTVAYDGTNYCGWQVQPNGLAVQEVLNRCLSEFLGTKTEVIGASRTDAGVHALGNVAVFDTEARMPAEKFSYALNTRLPQDIRIQDSCQVPEDFHPRFQETIKTYEYKIYNRQFRIRRNGCTRIFIIIRWMCKRCSRELDISSENMILKAFPPINRRWKIRFVQSMNLVFIDRKMM